jgi:hypothetical protein
MDNCYQGNDGKMTPAIKHVLENQQSMYPLILAASYSELLKPGHIEAQQRGREDEKEAKGLNSAPIRPNRQISRGGDVSPLPPCRKVSERNDVTPHRKTSSLPSECSARMQESFAATIAK